METVKFQQKMEIDEPRRYYLDKNPAITGKIPDGYMTGEEFVRQGIENIEKFCKEHGLLKSRNPQSLTLSGV